MNLNRQNVDERDRILFGEPYDPQKYRLGGIRRFKTLSFDDYAALLALGVIDPEDRQNIAPAAEEIMDFVRTHPDFFAHGYAVSPKRDDYRVSLEGVVCNGEYSMQDKLDFARAFRFASELDMEPDRLRCWYD